PVADIECRRASSTNRAALEAVRLRSCRTEMLTVTAVLPSKLKANTGLAVEIQLAQHVTAIATPDGILPWGKKSPLMFRAEYSHFPCSLRSSTQAIVCSKHIT